MTAARAISSPVLVGRRRELDILVAATTSPPHLIVTRHPHPPARPWSWPSPGVAAGGDRRPSMIHRNL
ncbi:MAG: hypothetical protein ACR2K0_06110 [Acidimicrobiales bacterium]